MTARQIVLGTGLVVMGLLAGSSGLTGAAVDSSRKMTSLDWEVPDGPGKLDPASHESDKAPQRSASNGYCMALVQTRLTGGAITLTASAEGLKPATVTFQARKGLSAPSTSVHVVTPPSASPLEHQLAQELVESLQKVYPRDEFIRSETIPAGGKCILVGQATEPLVSPYLSNERPVKPDAYTVTTLRQGALDLGIIAGANARGVAYGTYALLEKIGYGFYLSHDAVPSPKQQAFSFDDWKLSDEPLVEDRLIFNWHNFLSGCSSWNLPEWKSWIVQSQKQGYNAIMVHAYGNNPMFSFAFNGQKKPLGYLSTTARGRDWSTMHVNDVRHLYGGEVFDEAVFGSDAGKVPEENKGEAAQRLMQDVFKYAQFRGMNVFFSFDVDTASANAQALIQTLPAEARFVLKENNIWLPNPDTPDGYLYYKAQVESLLNAYPQITDLVAWFRREAAWGAYWIQMKLEDMPEAWQAEYRELVKQNPGCEKWVNSHNYFAISKIVRALDKALKETHHENVRLCAGSWNFNFLPSCNLFMPSHVKLIGLDHDVLEHRSLFETVSAQQAFAAVASKRAIIPVAWAHHDDRSYIGRPFTPFSRFCTQLSKMKANGFGVIHWTTRPLDLYTKSLSAQVWRNSRDQSLSVTCEGMAARSFGESTRKTMGKYLEEWVTRAPRFARETGDYFIGDPLDATTETIAGCRDRIRLIESVNLNPLTQEQRDRLNYYKGQEAFIASIYECQGHFESAQRAIKKGGLSEARTLAAHCHPESIIEQYAKYCSLGGITRGEQGLVITMNTRWLPHYVRQRQILGMEPIRYNFAPTSNDPLAQCPGTYTFHFGKDRTIWQTLGAEETGCAAFSLPVETNVTSDKTIPSGCLEVCTQGIESEKTMNIAINPIVNNPEEQFVFPQGHYKLRLLLLAPACSAKGQRVMKIAAGITADEQIQVATEAIAGETVDLFDKVGAHNRVCEHVISLHLQKPARVFVTLEPIQGKATLSGMVFETVN